MNCPKCGQEELTADEKKLGVCYDCYQHTIELNSIRRQLSQATEALAAKDKELAHLRTHLSNLASGNATLRKQLAQVKAEREAQEEIIDYYEGEMERSQYDDADLPAELLEAEAKLDAVRQAGQDHIPAEAAAEDEPVRGNEILTLRPKSSKKYIAREIPAEEGEEHIQGWPEAKPHLMDAFDDDAKEQPHD